MYGYFLEYDHIAKDSNRADHAIWGNWSYDRSTVTKITMTWAEEIWCQHPVLSGYKSGDLVRDAIATAVTEILSTTNQDFINDCFKLGGKPFVEAVGRFGCNEQGNPIRLSRSFEELLELIGDFRISVTETGGCAQIGKTISHTLLLCYCLTEGGLNPLWSYDTERSRDIQVPSNFRPVISGWLERKGSQKRRGQDKENNSLYQVDGATAQFVYVSTNASIGKSRQGLATASGTNVGVSRDIVFNEEKSQSRPGTRDPLLRRMDAGRLPSRPVRNLGTPGSGLGIEQDIAAADYDFYPHYECDRCRKILPLDPKGCLLKEFGMLTTTGEVQKTYLTIAGRPIVTQENNAPVSHWHHRDWKDAVQTAYFGCSHCGQPIRDEQRQNAWYQCKKQGVKLRDFLDSLPPHVLDRAISAGITISPLLRVESINTAAAMIKEGLETRNTDDWQQQRLGHPSIASHDGLTLQILQRAIGAPTPMRIPEVSLAGIDQGRREHWLWINDIYFPEGWQALTHEQLFEQSTRVCRFASDLEKGQVIDVIQTHRVKFGIVDNEPDIDWGATFCKLTGFEMADQRQQMDAIVAGEVSPGDGTFPCWKIRNSKFLRAVRNLFLSVGSDGYPLMRLPVEWEQWVSRIGDDRNPLKHLLSPSYDPGSGKWTRADDHVDDLYYAEMFCEVAFYLWLQRRAKSSGSSVSSVSKFNRRRR